MSDEDRVSDELKNELRLMAIEFLLADTLASRYLMASDPVAAATAHREHMRELWSQLAASQVAAPFLENVADSELVARRVGEAVDKLIEDAAQAVSRRMDEQRRR